MVNPRIGFMQGRLSPMINGKIQAFPWEYWKSEFGVAKELNIGLMEWTLDHENLAQNPLMSISGRKGIVELQNKFGVRIESLTGDFFMQAPFYKVTGSQRVTLLRELQDVTHACEDLGIKYLVLPLVDHGALTSVEMEQDVVETLTKLVGGSCKFVFESDKGPEDLLKFIKKFPREYFGINYDIGNSASLGFNPIQEINLYSDYIDNVHVKDRKLGGTTVPLGEGNADLAKVITLLEEKKYTGNYILQTARAADGEHSEAIKRYAHMTEKWMSKVAL